jgi:hypothetical protein
MGHLHLHLHYTCARMLTCPALRVLYPACLWHWRCLAVYADMTTKHLPPTVVAFAVIVNGAIIMVLASLVVQCTTSNCLFFPHHVTGSALLGELYMGIVNAGIGAFLLFFVLKHLGTARVQRCGAGARQSCAAVVRMQAVLIKLEGRWHSLHGWLRSPRNHVCRELDRAHCRD